MVVETGYDCGLEKVLLKDRHFSPPSHEANFHPQSRVNKIHTTPFCWSTFNTKKKNMGPSTARHPTERSCVVVFCFLASSDGGTLDTAFLVYGLIGCECHELRNFSDNKNTWLTWRCFLINPQKNKAGCFQKRMLCLSVCVFNALGSLGPKLWLGYTELMAADVLLHLATWDMGHRGWWQKP